MLPFVKKRTAPLILILSIGVGLSLLFSYYANQYQRDEIRLEMQKAAEEYAISVQAEITSIVELLHATAGLIAASVHVEQSEFELFANHALRDIPEISGLMWADVVPVDKLDDFIRELQQTGVNLEAHKSTRIRPPGQGPFLLTRLAYPLAPHTDFLGIDLYSDVLLRDVVNSAISSTHLQHLLVEKNSKPSDETSLWLVYPMFAIDKQALRGVVLTRIDLNLLFRSAYRHIDDDRGLDTYLFAGEIKANPKALYFHPSAVSQGGTPVAGQLVFNHTHALVPIQIANQKWHLVYRPATGIDAWHVSPVHWLAFLIGLVLTAIVLAYFITLWSRESYAEQLIAERTLALSDSESRLRSVFETVADGIVTINAQGIVQSYNRTAEKIFGYTADEVVGENISMLMPEPFSSRHNQYLAAYLNTGVAKIIGIGREVVGRHKSGRTFPIDLSVSEMQVGNERMFTGIVRDVSLIKRNERILQQTLAMQNAILDSAEFSIISTDTQGMIQTFNAGAQRMLGYGAAEMINKTTPAILHDPDEVIARAQELSNELGTDIEPGFEAFVAKARLGEVDERRWSYIRKDGSRLQVLLSITAVRDGAGKLVGFLGIGRDITDQLRTEQELRESEERFQLAVRGTNDGLWDWNILTNEVWFSPRFRELLGYSEDEFPNRFESWEGVLHPDDIELTMKNLNAHITRTGTDYDVHYRMRTKQGDYRWYRARGQAIWDTQGRAIRMAGSVMDITREKQVDNMKSEFISTVSHELRTPLTSIHGSLGLLAGGAIGELPDKARELLNIAKNNSERLLSLINDILDIEKIESGAIRFNLQPVISTEFVRHAIQANQGYANKHNVRLNVLEPVPLAYVRADEDRLMQVMNNLLSNAIKFSPAQGAVDIRVKHADDKLTIEVQDHGTGIPAEFHDKLFEKFTQADSSDTRKHPGTGLGLSIAKAIVERHDGIIGFRTGEDGTCFWFSIPIWQSQESGILLPQRDDEPIAGRHVLICEDEPDIANLIKLILHQHDFSCDIAFTAAQTKQLLKQYDYDAMTLDIMLPDQDGVSLISSLREEARFVGLPIIVVSAKADQARREINGVGFQVVDWMNKPIKQDRLLAVLENLLKDSPERPRILHVEDDHDVFVVIHSLLEDKAEIHEASTLASARQYLEQGRYTAVILDIQLPDGSGLELLDQINSFDPPIPVIVFSAFDLDEKLAQKVHANLVKSRTSNEKLVKTVIAALRRSSKTIT